MSTNSPTPSPAFLRRRKSLLIMPLIAIPFLAFVFYSLGGGQGTPPRLPAAGSFMGFNRDLPKAKFDRQEGTLDKMGYYQRADADSLRKKEYGQRDPYAASVSVPEGSPHPADSPRHTAPNSDSLLSRLDRLRQSLRQPVVSPRPSTPLTPGQVGPGALGRLQELLHTVRPADTPAVDPQIERLNRMLDKILRIQHPESAAHPSLAPANDSTIVHTIPAVVQDDQTLVNGATLAFRLSEAILLKGLLLPKGQLVYGIANLNKDRVEVDIRSIRNGTDIYPVNWQVYDLDGLPGIHIPGMLTREVAKQSADQGISGLNIVSLDPSLGAQAANAGIQATKSLFSHKVRAVRVGVRAGYQVLLRGTQTTNYRQPVPPVSDTLSETPQPPGFVPGGSLSHTRLEGMELSLRTICLEKGVCWFALSLSNHSPIDFIPEYTRWFIRDRRQFKRTAIQELPLQPVYTPLPPFVAGDSTQLSWTGLQPFALAKDKELVVQIGEKGNGRLLTLVIDHRKLLNAQKL